MAPRLARFKREPDANGSMSAAALAIGLKRPVEEAADADAVLTEIEEISKMLASLISKLV
jgi:hypothetical protein